MTTNLLAVIWLSWATNVTVTPCANGTATVTETVSQITYAKFDWEGRKITVPIDCRQIWSTNRTNY